MALPNLARIGLTRPARPPKLTLLFGNIVMTTNFKRGLIVTACVLVIAASCIWIYFTQFKAAKFNVSLHQRIGEVLAEQTAKLVGGKGKVVTIAIETKEWPELRTQLYAFNTALAKLGKFEVRDYELDTKDKPKYTIGNGLSGRRYVRIVNKNTNASVFVSFVGAPHLKKDDLEQLSFTPKLIAESRSPEDVARMFEKKLLDVAIVSRFQFPSPSPKSPATPDEWFTKQYQIVTLKTASALPRPLSDSE
jgi:hypothetical protein